MAEYDSRPDTWAHIHLVQHARDSLDRQQQRFGFSDDLKQILLNTLPLLDGSNPHT